jgi:paraquat-inducible protein B
MKHEDPDNSDIEELPEIAVEKKGGFSIVWIIPIVAALVGGWLVYKTISEKGPTITISFSDGAGLEAGKTKIKYKSIEAGVVQDVDITDDLSQVIVTAEMKKTAHTHLTENTRFWVVRPQIGLGGISGLDTLVSGAYIEIDPQSGTPTLEFTGLDTPPKVTSREEGTQYVLVAQKLGGLQPGSPLDYHGVQAGEVMDYHFTEDGQNLLINIFIKAPFDKRIREHTQFWNSSGIQAKVGAEGINVEVASFAALIAGGISFDTPIIDVKNANQSPEGSTFELYKSYDTIGESAITTTRPFIAMFSGSLRGLSIGAPVEFKGIRVGTVTDIKSEVDSKSMKIDLPVYFQIEPQRIRATSTSDEIVVETTAQSYKNIDAMVRRGMRAQLMTGSLLTGQLYVDLDFHPDLPVKGLNYKRKYPVMPSVPTTMDEFRTTAHSLLRKLRNLPLDKIAHEILETTEGANHLVNSPEVQEAVHNLNAALGNVEKLTEGMDKRVNRLQYSVEKTLLKARQALELADPNSPAAVNLNSALKELSAAARSIRVLADYLEQHPEALVKGKK